MKGRIQAKFPGAQGLSLEILLAILRDELLKEGQEEEADGESK